MYKIQIDFGGREEKLRGLVPVRGPAVEKHWFTSHCKARFLDNELKYDFKSKKLPRCSLFLDRAVFNNRSFCLKAFV